MLLSRTSIIGPRGSDTHTRTISADLRPDLRPGRLVHRGDFHNGSKCKARNARWQVGHSVLCLLPVICLKRSIPQSNALERAGLSGPPGSAPDAGVKSRGSPWLRGGRTIAPSNFALSRNPPLSAALRSSDVAAAPEGRHRRAPTRPAATHRKDGYQIVGFRAPHNSRAAFPLLP